MIYSFKENFFSKIRRIQKLAYQIYYIYNININIIENVYDITKSFCNIPLILWLTIRGN